jgi:hypothetical protein
VSRQARRWQLAGLALAVVIVIGAVSALIASHHPPRPGNSSSAQAAGQRLASASAVRSQAVGWVATQVGRNASVACDRATCAALAARGFPASDLTVLLPTAPNPFGSQLVIATADIRSQFGSRLAAVYAPQVIASFGAGPTRIDIRVIAPHGPAAFRLALSSDVAARKSSAAQVLRNARITISASARAQLTSGLVDMRVLATIVFLGRQHPLDIISFGGMAPGATPGVPLRIVYLAESDTAAHVTSGAYVQSLESALQSQSPPYVPLSVGSVHLAGGPSVLKIVFAAPSPLGLLQS